MAVENTLNAGINKRNEFDIKTYQSSKILTLNEILLKSLGEDVCKDISSHLKLYFDIDIDSESIPGIALTYFDHKVPDSVSLPKSIRNGEIRNSNGEITNKTPFIEEVTPPYKQ